MSVELRRMVWGFVAVAGAVAAGSAWTAMAYNAAHPGPPGISIGGVPVDLQAIGNWAWLAIGGSAGALGIFQAFIRKVSPNLVPVVDTISNNPLANQFAQQLPLLLTLLSAGKSARGVLKFDEVVNEVPVQVTIYVGKIDDGSDNRTVVPEAEERKFPVA